MMLSLREALVIQVNREQRSPPPGLLLRFTDLGRGLSDSTGRLRSLQVPNQMIFNGLLWSVASPA